MKLRRILSSLLAGAVTASSIFVTGLSLTGAVGAAGEVPTVVSNPFVNGEISEKINTINGVNYENGVDFNRTTVSALRTNQIIDNTYKLRFKFDDFTNLDWNGHIQLSGQAGSKNQYTVGGSNTTGKDLTIGSDGIVTVGSVSAKLFANGSGNYNNGQAFQIRSYYGDFKLSYVEFLNASDEVIAKFDNNENKSYLCYEIPLNSEKKGQDTQFSDFDWSLLTNAGPGSIIRVNFSDGTAANYQELIIKNNWSNDAFRLQLHDIIATGAYVDIYVDAINKLLTVDKKIVQIYGATGNHITNSVKLYIPLTVTFHTESGEKVANVYDSVIDSSEISTPTKTGYTFLGWSTAEGDSSKIIDLSTSVTSKIDLYPIFRKDIIVKFYLSSDGTIASDGTYDSSGMYNSPISEITVPYGNKLQTGDIPTPPLAVVIDDVTYNFAGWKNNGVAFTTNTIITVAADDDIYNVFAAYTTDPIYTVEYYDIQNDITTLIDTETVIKDNNITKTTLSDNGDYEFDYWAVGSFEGTAYDNTAPVTSDGLKLYAVWALKYFYADFNSNGGSAINQVKVEKTGNGILAAPTAPTKANYDFAGWYKDEALNTAWNFDSDTVNGDITLYAKWTLKKFTVTFNVNGGSAVAALNNVEYGSKITAPTAPTREGYEFLNWYKDSATTTLWDFDSDTVDANTTLYARWRVLEVPAYIWGPIDFSTAKITDDKQYVIEDADNGKQYGIQCYAASQDPQQAKIEIADGALVLTALTGTHKQMTLMTGTAVGGNDYYATDGFEPEIDIEYKVTFDAKVSSGEGQIRIWGNAKTDTDESFKKAFALGTEYAAYEYTYTQKAGGGNMILDSGNTPVDIGICIKNLKIESIVDESPAEDAFKITFNANGGTGTMSNITGIASGSEKELTANSFTRSGYTFSGWATSESGSKVYDNKATITNITANITLYAVWTADSTGGDASGTDTPTYINPLAPKDTTSTDSAKEEAKPVSVDAVKEALKSDAPVIKLKSGETKITMDIIAEIKSAGKVVTFETDDGIKIEIDPSKITDGSKEIDLSVKVDLAVKATILENNVKVPANSIIITPSASGEFGFTLGIVLPASAFEEAGVNPNNAKLFYIDDDGNVSEIGKAVVRDDGSVKIEITHASQYVLSENPPEEAPDVEFDEEDDDDAEADDNSNDVDEDEGDDFAKTETNPSKSNTNDNTSADDSESSSTSGEGNPKTGVGMTAVLAGLVASGLTAIITGKKKRK